MEQKVYLVSKGPSNYDEPSYILGIYTDKAAADAAAEAAYQVTLAYWQGFCENSNENSKTKQAEGADPKMYPIQTAEEVRAEALQYASYERPRVTEFPLNTVIEIEW